MSTPLSTSTTYCTAAKLLTYYDRRTVAQLLSDSGTAVADGDLEDDPRLATILLAASGMVESAALVGERYNPTDLTGLTGAGEEFLNMLVADLAFGRLALRRPERQRVPASYEEALHWLDRLRLGERIFSLQETADAGHYELNELTESDLEESNLATYRAQRLFGVRGGRDR